MAYMDYEGYGGSGSSDWSQYPTQGAYESIYGGNDDLYAGFKGGGRGKRGRS